MKQDLPDAAPAATVPSTPDSSTKGPPAGAASASTRRREKAAAAEPPEDSFRALTLLNRRPLATLPGEPPGPESMPGSASPPSFWAAGEPGKEPEARPKMRDLALDERPRERLFRHGVSTLSDSDLVAVLLRTGRPGASALGLARQILAERGGLQGLARLDLGELQREGMGRAKLSSLLAAAEIGRRLAFQQVKENCPFSRPAELAGYLRLRYGRLDQEVMGALFLDSRNRLISEQEIFRGIHNRVLVDPRPVFREALVRDAAGVVLFHTHPSGDPSPSLEDTLFTERMQDAGDILGVALVDHLILSPTGAWRSLLRGARVDAAEGAAGAGMGTGAGSAPGEEAVEGGGVGP